MLSTREKADTAHIFLQDEFATFRMGFKQINLLRDGIKTLISFKINDSGNTKKYLFLGIRLINIFKKQYLTREAGLGIRQFAHLLVSLKSNERL